ncbi:MAG: hypothetical protein IT320_10355 [Anaerolineae bacterium]|nr:hypothetical protein [Anaerolineae bacterium]
MYAQNDLFFPYRAIAALSTQRGEEWQTLVQRVLSLPELHEETLAFMWMMVRLNGCAGCETDSYRAMRGCAACAIQTLRRFKDDDAALLRAYDEALADVRRFARRDDRYAVIVGEGEPEVSAV